MARILKLVVSLCYFGWRRLCAALLGLRGRRLLDHVVLYYHGLPEDGIDAFARQMDLLLRSARPFAPADSPRSDGGRQVAVTFDDGFVSFLRNALPVLVERGIPSAVFVPSGWLGQRPGWIAERGHSDRRDEVMTEQDLRGLPAELVEIGSHTVSHADLTRLSAEGVGFELEASKRDLELALGRKVRLLSFPYGAWDDVVALAARHAGYGRAFSIEPEPVSSDGSRFVVGRVPASPGDWRIEFWLKLRGAYAWLAGARRLKSRLRSGPAVSRPSVRVPQAISNTVDRGMS